MAEKLALRGVDAAAVVLPGSHGFAYCRAHMEEYLRFYGNQQGGV